MALKALVMRGKGQAKLQQQEGRKIMKVVGL